MSSFEKWLNPPKNQFQRNDDGTITEYRYLCVHKFQFNARSYNQPTIWDVNNTQLWHDDGFKGQFSNWANTEQGKWALEHAVEMPKIERVLNYIRDEYDVFITVRMKAQDCTFWQMKWGNVDGTTGSAYT